MMLRQYYMSASRGWKQTTKMTMTTPMKVTMIKISWWRGRWSIYLVAEDCSSSLARWPISRADWLYPDLIIRIIYFSLFVRYLNKLTWPRARQKNLFLRKYWLNKSFMNIENNLSGWSISRKLTGGLRIWLSGSSTDLYQRKHFYGEQES